jgi:hypothetical protein
MSYGAPVHYVETGFCGEHQKQHSRAAANPDCQQLSHRTTNFHVTTAITATIPNKYP